MRNGILHPEDVVFIPSLQVARLIVFNKLLGIGTLIVVFSYFVSFFKPTDDSLDSLTVKAISLIHILVDGAVSIFHQLGV